MITGNVTVKGGGGYHAAGKGFLACFPVTFPHLALRLAFNMPVL